MMKCSRLASSVFASFLIGFCAQNAGAANREPYVIEDQGDLAYVKDNLEVQCREGNGEVLESTEVGPRDKVIREVNGRKKTSILTVWKVVCRRQRFDGKMPALVVVLGNGSVLSKSTTLNLKVRERLLSAAAKDDENCASKLVELIKTLKQDSDLRESSQELEQLLGAFTVAITVDPGTENRSTSLPNLLDTSGFNHIERIGIMTPDYEMLGEIDPKWVGADGKPNSVEKMDELLHSTCTVAKDDILGLVRRTIKELKLQKEQENIFSKRKTARRAIASSPDRSITATFIEMP